MSPHSTFQTRQNPPKRVFFATLIVIFFSAMSATDSVGFVPCSLDDTCGHSQSVALSSLPVLGLSTSSGQANDSVAVSGVEPVRIEVASVGIDLPVQNPATRDIQALDDLLQQGPARYTDSARLGEDGNVLIFAHSSHLPIVRNQMFRAFNAVPDLKTGDSITLVGDDGKKYLYSVESVVQADTNDGTQIPLSPALGKKLTLVTCNTLVGKSARWILTANFVGTI